MTRRRYGPRRSSPNRRTELPCRPSRERPADHWLANWGRWLRATGRNSLCPTIAATRPEPALDWPMAGSKVPAPKGATREERNLHRPPSSSAKYSGSAGEPASTPCDLATAGGFGCRGDSRSGNCASFSCDPATAGCLGLLGSSGSSQCKPVGAGSRPGAVGFGRRGRSSASSSAAEDNEARTTKPGHQKNEWSPADNRQFASNWKNLQSLHRSTPSDELRSTQERETTTRVRH